MKSRLEKSDSAGYAFAVFACLFFVMTRYFHADFFDNEWIYSLNPIKLLQPEFLANDFYLDRAYPFFLFFDVLTAPLYYFLDHLTAVLILRILIWTFQLWALSQLAKTMGITWWGFILLIVIWLNVEQTLTAGAWIILSANSKPVAYGFMFLALDSLLKNRIGRTGVFAGLAAAFHVIVGFYLCAALLLTLLATRLDRGQIKAAVQFSVLAFVLALPGIVPPFYGEFRNILDPAYSGTAAEVARINTVFANPFHMDPDYFMTALEPLKVGFFFLAAPALLWSVLPRKQSKQLVPFIVFICLFFLSGVLARRLEWWSYLKYFPFRLGDAFVPLAFWMGAVLAFQKAVRRNRDKRMALAALVLAVPFTIGFANYAIDLCEPAPSRRYQATPRSFLTALSRTEPRMTAFHFRERISEWRSFFNRQQSDLAAMERWIQKNTPNGSIFIRPPWLHSFSIKAQRADFVSIKPYPGPKVIEYVERIKQLNRGAFETAGHEIFFELMENYPLLTGEEIVRIKCRYGADFFLTNADRGYDFELVHQIGAYTLYRIQKIFCEDKKEEGKNV